MTETITESSRSLAADPAVEVEPLTIADRTFNSRLLLGTGKFSDSRVMVRSF